MITILSRISSEKVLFASIVLGAALKWWFVDLQVDDIRTRDKLAGEWAASHGSTRFKRLSDSGYYVLWSAQDHPGGAPPTPTYIYCDLSRCEGVPDAVYRY